MNELQEALRRILGALDAVEASGEQLSDEEAFSTGEVIQGLMGRIRELQQPNETIPSGADLAWILSGGDPQAFTQYLQSIPDPALNALARNPAQLQYVIQELDRRITVPHGEVSEEGIPHADLQSSNVYGFSYNPRRGNLFVRFQNGGVYEYEGVPPQVFKQFSRGAVPARTNGQNQFGRWWEGKMPSLGAAFYNLIREGGYDYQRVA